ncbi:alpha/beta fold hydrolase [Streptomyces sp. JV185]|uniref:alpha/beta fold hydrolase n=1 Tax=Streptomyces sp. JV185 TaxID=858638 RepID=UPI002E775962|nr:alpha/beta fold hydrolase [Streptomyces sp. JV185]MEE1769998.1 alpha/beta fold hydrolase [Streptomyces sp. JV185]
MPSREAATPPTAFLDVAGHAVRYTAVGSGPPVLLLHGLDRSLADWAPLQAALPDHRLIAIDVPGFGRSQPLPDCRLASLSGHVERVLDGLEVASAVHVVGNSLGGAIAMQLTVHAPERVSSLTLLNSAGFGREVTWALRILDLPLLWRLLLRPDEGNARLTERSLFHDPEFATPERIAAALALARREGAARTLRQVARDLGSWRGVRSGWRAKLLAEVSALATPTLVVWGTHDRILPARHLINAASALPRARTHLFPRTGHLPQIERTAETAALLRSFWNDL